MSASIDGNRTEIVIPTTFKDISAFFENKALANSSSQILEQKKIVRAKRSVVLNRQIPNDFKKLEIISSTTENEYHQIKRIKTTHKSQFDSIELVINNSSVESSIQFNQTSTKKTLLKQWFIPLLFIIIILVYFGSMKIYKDSIRVFSQQSKKSIDLTNNNNLISRYGQFVRNRFVYAFDLLLTYLSQLFFRIDKYEYKNNIVYIVTSTYEQLYDWFITQYMNRR